MSLTSLLNRVQPVLRAHAEAAPSATIGGEHPACVLFFAVCNGADQAHIQIASGADFDAAWQKGAQALQRWLRTQKRPPQWLRVDWVDAVEALDWRSLQALLGRTKRNYFERGIALSADFACAIHPQELGANALLYDSSVSECTPNAGNLARYGARRFGRALAWPDAPGAPVWVFSTRGVFCDGSAVHAIEHAGRHQGYRTLPDWGPQAVLGIVRRATRYLAGQVQRNGLFHYGWFPCFDRPIPTYNALRHASSTYALLEGWELTRDEHDRAAAGRALAALTQQLIRSVTLPDGVEAAFLVDTGDEIKLGGNAVSLLALAKYTELSGDRQYLPLMERLALGILFMQRGPEGGFVHVLAYPDLALKAAHRIIYYDGEAAFGLMRLYGLTRDARWLAAVERAMDHFIAAGHAKAHDHWLSYCVNELTLHRPDPRYFRFGLDNVCDHLDFVIERITTYPTLLELMMAAERMIARLGADPAHGHLLADFDLPKFYRALETRARYLMNGFFFPERAMFFRNPGRIVDGFFIRHHGYRVRIDDVEHYLSGYVAYWKYRTAGGAAAGGAAS